MSETLTAPVVDPEEFSPEEMDAIREAERNITEQLDRYVSAPDAPNARRNLTESLEREAVADPKTFLAAREKLSAFTDEADPSDEQIEKEGILKDVIDGPLRARTVTKYGIFAAPTPEVRARVERAVEAVREAESDEGKHARKRSYASSLGANTNALKVTRKKLQDAIENGEGDAVLDIHRQAIRNLNRSMDIQGGGTGNTKEEVKRYDRYVAKIRRENPDIEDDDPAFAKILKQRDDAQSDYETVKTRIEGRSTLAPARERLRKLLDEHPEGMDVVHRLEREHIGYASGEKVDENYNEKQQKLTEARAKVAELWATTGPGDGRLALAQIAEYKAQEAFNEVDAHHTKDKESAAFLTGLAEENDRAKRVLEQQEEAMGSLEDIEEEVFEGLAEWQSKNTAVSEHGAFVGMKKAEAYISLLDEKIAIAKEDSRDLPHLRALRDSAFDVYLQLQYHKEVVRTEKFANAGDFEGRYGLAHTENKGILVERGNGAFVIYPDGTHSSVYEEGGEQLITPRVNAQGERVTTPVLEQIPDPRALVEPATIAAWEAMSLDDLKNAETAIYGGWLSDPSNNAARARLEVVAGILREQSAWEDNTLTHMEATYTERYMAVGRDGNPDRLMPDGSVAGHMTLHGIEGGWVVRPNGAADLYTPGVNEPVSRYAPDGTILNAFGPETDPSEPPETPDSPDDGGEGGDGGAPDDDREDEPEPEDEPEATASPVTPVAPAPTPTPPIPGGPARPGSLGGVRPSARFLHPTPETDIDDGLVDGELLPAPTPEATGEPEEEDIVDAEIVEPTPAPTPAPATPEDKKPAAPKPERPAPQPISPEDRKMIQDVIARGSGQSAVYSQYDTLEQGPVAKVQGGSEISREDAHKRLYGKSSSWSPEDRARYNVAAESIVLTQHEDRSGLTNFQYRYQPASSDQSNHLIIDTDLPNAMAAHLTGRIMENPAIARDVAQQLYENAFGRGSWEAQGRPPYEQISDAELTVAMNDTLTPGAYVTSKYAIG